MCLICKASHTDAGYQRWLTAESPLSVTGADQQHVTFSDCCSISYRADLHKNIILFLFIEYCTNIKRQRKCTNPTESTGWNVWKVVYMLPVIIQLRWAAAFSEQSCKKPILPCTPITTRQTAQHLPIFTRDWLDSRMQLMRRPSSKESGSSSSIRRLCEASCNNDGGWQFSSLYFCR